MKSVNNTVLKNKIFASNDVVAVACSGGVDSMVLLHYLNSQASKFKIKVVAVTINHQIRENGKSDAAFVENYCKKHGIECYSFSGDVPAMAKKNKQGIEEAARDFRYKMFNKLLKEKKATKIALGHHMQDQTETVLLNILRGTGIAGASGMEVVRDGVFVRPLLNTSKTEIMAYASQNDVPYVEDETNQNHEYARNYLRNLIMPLIRNKWKNADITINNFAKLCKQDDDYINESISDAGIVIENEQTVKLPVSYFVLNDAVVGRLILRSLKQVGVNSGIEEKHINIIKNLALNSENGAKVNLPDKLFAIKEYNYITLTNKNIELPQKTWKLKTGKTDIPHFGVLEVARGVKIELEDYHHVIDAQKVSKNAVWRYRQDGDVFEKFGGGTKSLSDYLTDIKVPRRIRDTLPVLAHGSEVLVVAGYQISDKVKVDNSTKSKYGINAVRF